MSGKSGQKNPQNPAYGVGSGAVGGSKKFSRYKDFGELGIGLNVRESFWGPQANLPPAKRAQDSMFTKFLREHFRKLNYELDELVGRGGMGAVYKARYTGNPDTFGIPAGGKVAIKLLYGFMMSEPDERTRFFREAELLRALRHPNIVQTYELGEINQMPFFAMELLEGRNLEEVIRERGGIELNRALRITKHVCAALALAHSKGIVHRDIKPGNIFIVNGGEKVKVIDLGIAKLINQSVGESGITLEGEMLGTPAYLAPEIASGVENYDHRIDIYGLGVSMYEMITGNIPFDCNDAMQMVRMHMGEEPPPMGKRRPDLRIPGEVELMVMKCLEKKPGDRFQSAEELCRAIDACGVEKTGPLVSVVPGAREEEGPKEETREVKKRNWAKVLLPPVALAVVIGAGAFFAGTDETMDESAEGAVAYTAKIDADVPGVSVVLEEKLEDGTIVDRRLGETPLEVPLEGTNTVFLEKEGYRRAYLEITPEKNAVMQKMEKRE